MFKADRDTCDSSSVKFYITAPTTLLLSSSSFYAILSLKIVIIYIKLLLFSPILHLKLLFRYSIFMWLP